MKLNKEKFLKTELGANLVDCVTCWDKMLFERSKYTGCATFRDEYRKVLEVLTWCQAQWEVYQMMLRQFYGIEYHFTRTYEYFGIVSHNDDFLFKSERQV